MAKAHKVVLHYWNLKVSMTAATQKLTGCGAYIGSTITDYRNLNFPNTMPSDTMTRKDELMTAFNSDKSADKPGYPDIMPRWYPEAFMAVFSGYGSPEEIETVLTLVAHYGAKKKIALPQPVSSNMEAPVRAYARKYLGLDCLGLVSNCANTIFGDSGKYRLAAADPKLGARGVTGYTLLARPGERISSAGAIKPYMGIIYAVGNSPARHGVMIDTVTDMGSTLKLDVVESLGEGKQTGLRSSAFEIAKDASGPIFTIKRNSPFVSTERVFVVEYKR